MYVSQSSNNPRHHPQQGQKPHVSADRTDAAKTEPKRNVGQAPLPFPPAKTGLPQGTPSESSSQFRAIHGYLNARTEMAAQKSRAAPQKVAVHKRVTA